MLLWAGDNRQSQRILEDNGRHWFERVQLDPIWLGLKSFYIWGWNKKKTESTKGNFKITTLMKTWCYDAMMLWCKKKNMMLWCYDAMMKKKTRCYYAIMLWCFKEWCYDAMMLWLTTNWFISDYVFKVFVILRIYTQKHQFQEVQCDKTKKTDFCNPKKSRNFIL